MSQPIGYSERVWNGDPDTIADARQHYERDPFNGLIPYATALYSLRHKRKFANALIELADELIEFATRDMNTFHLITEEECRKAAERADTVSTHLEWISRQRELSADRRYEARQTAWQFCRYGIRFATEGLNRKIDHTLPLLRLTMAQIQLSKKAKRLAIQELQLVENSILLASIPDPNQRVRVYRKLGMLYRSCWQIGDGFAWIIRSIRVPGATRAVRLKSVAALIGIGL